MASNYATPTPLVLLQIQNQAANASMGNSARAAEFQPNSIVTSGHGNIGSAPIDSNGMVSLLHSSKALTQSAEAGLRFTQAHGERGTVSHNQNRTLSFNLPKPQTAVPVPAIQPPMVNKLLYFMPNNNAVALHPNAHSNVNANVIATPDIGRNINLVNPYQSPVPVFQPGFQPFAPSPPVQQPTVIRPIAPANIYQADTSAKGSHVITSTASSRDSAFVKTSTKEPSSQSVEVNDCQPLSHTFYTKQVQQTLSMSSNGTPDPAPNLKQHQPSITDSVGDKVCEQVSDKVEEKIPSNEKADQTRDQTRAAAEPSASKRPHRDQEPKYSVTMFIKRLWTMVSEHNAIVRWHPSGLAVIIDMVLFQTKIRSHFPTFMHTSTFDAYHRNLLQHGFQYIRSADDYFFRLFNLKETMIKHPTWAVYYHPCFSMGRPDLLWRIQKLLPHPHRGLRPPQLNRHIFQQDEMPPKPHSYRGEERPRRHPKNGYPSSKIFMNHPHPYKRDSTTQETESHACSTNDHHHIKQGDNHIAPHPAQKHGRVADDYLPSNKRHHHGGNSDALPSYPAPSTGAPKVVFIPHCVTSQGLLPIDELPNNFVSSAAGQGGNDPKPCCCHDDKRSEDPEDPDIRDNTHDCHQQPSASPSVQIVDIKTESMSSDDDAKQTDSCCSDISDTPLTDNNGSNADDQSFHKRRPIRNPLTVKLRVKHEADDMQIDDEPINIMDCSDSSSCSSFISVGTSEFDLEPENGIMALCHAVSVMEEQNTSIDPDSVPNTISLDTSPRLGDTHARDCDPEYNPLVRLQKLPVHQLPQ